MNWVFHPDYLASAGRILEIKGSCNWLFLPSCSDRILVGANPRIRGEMAEKVGGTLGKRPTNSEEKCQCVALYFFCFSLWCSYSSNLWILSMTSVLVPCSSENAKPCCGCKFQGCETIFEARSPS